MSGRGQSCGTRGRGGGLHSGRDGQRNAQIVGGGRGRGRGRGRVPIASHHGQNGTGNTVVLTNPYQSGQGNGSGRGGGRGRGRGRGQGRGANTATTAAPAPPCPPPIILSNPPTPWGKSRAKKLARELLMEPDSWVQGMPATHVYYNHPLFEQYDKTNFANNYNALQRTVKADRLAIEFDQLRLTEDKEVHPRAATTNGGQPFWDTHPAKPRLIEELKSGIIKNLTPEQVRNRRDEYKDFDLPYFRQYLNMEKRHLRENVFWQAKRNRKGRKEYENQVESADTYASIQTG